MQRTHSHFLSGHSLAAPGGPRAAEMGLCVWLFSQQSPGVWILHQISSLPHIDLTPYGLYSLPRFVYLISLPACPWRHLNLPFLFHPSANTPSQIDTSPANPLLTPGKRLNQPWAIILHVFLNPFIGCVFSLPRPVCIIFVSLRFLTKDTNIRNLGKIWASLFCFVLFYCSPI